MHCCRHGWTGSRIFRWWKLRTRLFPFLPLLAILVGGYNVNNELLCAYGRYCFYICRFGPEPTSKETTGMKAIYICWIKRYKVLQYPLWPLCELSRGCEPPLHIYANPVGHHHRDREIGMTFLLAKLCARRNVWVWWVQFKISLYCPIQSEMPWRVLQLTPPWSRQCPI